MSFVSIAGNKKYINVMSDGLAVYHDGTKEENWEKFVNYDNKRFIAFAGTVHYCQNVVSEAYKCLELPYDQWVSHIKKYVLNMPYSQETGKAIICVGGKDGTLKFSSFSNKPGQDFCDFELVDDDIHYVFLSNMDEEHLLDEKFMEFAKRYRSAKSRDILLAQRDLNNYVSDLNPNTVNKNTSYFVLKL
ncbi:hypothetical protein IGL01_000718 [Enterococcus sp. DIV0340]|uniref:hypothetical protein n=1 Tax=unclassified Enterococcus TaxID=2608891 RepID=UPI003D2FB2FD